jgi:hypothetical protein
VIEDRINSTNKLSPGFLRAGREAFQFDKRELLGVICFNVEAPFESIDAKLSRVGRHDEKTIAVLLPKISTNVPDYGRRMREPSGHAERSLCSIAQNLRVRHFAVLELRDNVKLDAGSGCAEIFYRYVQQRDFR